MRVFTCISWLPVHTVKKILHSLINTKMRLSDVSAFVAKHDTYLFDCDGVIYRSGKVIDGATEVLDLLRKSGKRVLFITNNSTISREAYLNKFKKLNIQASKEEIVSSSFATASYLKSINFKKKVFIVGEIGIAEELKEAGIESLGGVDFNQNETIQQMSENGLKLDPEVGAVVVGWDRNINYRKIAYAMRYLEDSNVLFLATNKDSSFPSPAGKFPGSGTMVAAVETCSGRIAKTMGKPSANVVKVMQDVFGVNKETTCIIGDRLDTDIKIGTMTGITSVLVLTGVTKEEHIEGNPIQPDHVLDSIADFLPGLQGS